MYFPLDFIGSGTSQLIFLGCPPHRRVNGGLGDQPGVTIPGTIWSEWRLTVIAATVRIALVDILDLSEVDIPAGVFLHPAVGWG